MTSHNALLVGKVCGTWNLHASAEAARAPTTTQRAPPLDIFTLLSSLSGVVGKTALANYAAGNAFLDAFARSRCARGRRAHTMALGIVDVVGYMAGRKALKAPVDPSIWTHSSEAVLRRIFTCSNLQLQQQQQPTQHWRPMPAAPLPSTMLMLPS
jgi:hypothetical protein